MRTRLVVLLAAAATSLAAPALAVPPVESDFGSIPTSGTTVTRSGSITDFFQIKWYQLTVADAIVAAEGTYLDIDLNANPVSAAIGDAELGLFNSSGALVATDDDNGTGSRPQISFGAGSRAAPGDGLAYNGQNGANLPVGTYYLAVSGFETAFALTGFGATTISNYTGAYVVSARSGKMPGYLPVVDIDLGSIRGDNSGPETPSMAINAGQIRWVHFKLDEATSAASIYCDMHTRGSIMPVFIGSNPDDTEFVLFNSAGAVVLGNGSADDWPNGSQTYLSGGSFGRTTGARGYQGSLTNFAGQSGAVLAAGDYYVALGGFNMSNAAGFVAGSNCQASGSVKFGVYTNITPIVDYDLGLIRTPNAPAVTPDLPIAPDQTVWVKFRISEPTNAGTLFLDMHTFGSAFHNGPAADHDTVLQLYRPDGSTVGFSDDLSIGNAYSGLSFGATGQARNYAGIPTLTGSAGAVLPAGTYYAAITAFGNNVMLGSDFRLVADHPYTGTVRLTIATNMGSGQVTDLGVVSRVNSPLSISGLSLAAGQIRWFHFRTAAATNAGALFLDMHTDGSILTTSTPNDAETCLYDAQGVKLHENDDWYLTPGFQSGMSYGMTSPARAYGPLVSFVGQDGAVLPAGDYYVALIAFDGTFGSDFGVNAASTATGTIKLTVITNLPAFPCNIADVASLGGILGADHQLTVDDIVVYLSQFFAGNLAVADIAGLGGSLGADGIITVDDLVAFLSAFFAPCN